MAEAAAFAALCGGILTVREHLLLDLPPWVRFSDLREEKYIHAASGDEAVTISLRDSVLRISGDTLLFAGESGWAVADCFVCDIDRDGFDEVMLHVWKRGSFGKHHPFWREDDKARCSEHLFIYEWDTQRPDRLDPIWMSSAMPVQGQTITVDPAGILHITAPDGSCTLWQWGSWGLVRYDTE